mmetsp:Transcript_36904/g.70959  ORF Transcript_36904/g.70959 Transcript_36904/m.70959 type:complete len:105 (-) Transcript_36904:115-429(-)
MWSTATIPRSAAPDASRNILRSTFRDLISSSSAQSRHPAMDCLQQCQRCFLRHEQCLAMAGFAETIIAAIANEEKPDGAFDFDMHRQARREGTTCLVRSCCHAV